MPTREIQNMTQMLTSCSSQLDESELRLDVEEFIEEHNFKICTIESIVNMTGLQKAFDSITHGNKKTVVAVLDSEPCQHISGSRTIDGSRFARDCRSFQIGNKRVQVWDIFIHHRLFQVFQELDKKEPVIRRNVDGIRLREPALNPNTARDISLMTIVIEREFRNHILHIIESEKVQLDAQLLRVARRREIYNEREKQTKAFTMNYDARPKTPEEEQRELQQVFKKFGFTDAYHTPEEPTWQILTGDE
jgi:hypothetical protein